MLQILGRQKKKKKKLKPNNDYHTTKPIHLLSRKKKHKENILYLYKIKKEEEIHVRN
jgi:hypothetical protein